MRDLIDQLRVEHEELMKMFSDISKLRIKSPESRKVLLEIKEKLFTHIEKEEREVYNKIEEIGIPSVKVKEYIKTYSLEMASISQISIIFFKRLELGKMRQSEYTADIERIIFLLKARISWEESMFYIFDREKQYSK